MSIARIWELISRKNSHEITAEELNELEQLLRSNQHDFPLVEFLTGLRELPLQPGISPLDEARSREIIAKAIRETEIRTLDGEFPGYENTEDVYGNTLFTPGLDSSRVEEVVEKRRPIFLSGYAWLSAAVLVIITLSVLLIVRKKTAEASLTGSLKEVVTAGGSRTKVILPDGSSVFLNVGSKIYYNRDFGLNDREIFLDGEAFFDVAKNETIPLTVRAGNVVIRVLGTVFNVKAYTEDSVVETSLINGLIQVWSKNDTERKMLIRPHEKIVIGRSVHLYSDVNISEPKKQDHEIFKLDEIKVNPADSSIAEIAWIQNKLVFQNEAFFTLAQRMARWYNVKIVFKNTSLGQLRFTGSLEKENLTEALDALRLMEPFSYVIEDRTVTISRK